MQDTIHITREVWYKVREYEEVWITVGRDIVLLHMDGWEERYWNWSIKRGMEERGDRDRIQQETPKIQSHLRDFMEIQLG